MRIFNTHSTYEAVGQYVGLNSTNVMEMTGQVHTDHNNQMIIKFENTLPDLYMHLSDRSFLCESFGTDGVELFEDETDDICIKVIEIERHIEPSYQKLRQEEKYA